MGKKQPDFKLYTEDPKKYFMLLEEELSGRLKKSRFRHTLLVAGTAACLAMRYGADMNSAYLAGLLHDCAKNLEDERMLKTAKKYKLELTDFERANPFILHGPVGACISRAEFEITDEDILNAIRNHTTGRAGMSLLEKIIFIADYIEPGRDAADNLALIRKMAFEDIDVCLKKILEDTLIYLNSTGKPVDDKTEITAAYYGLCVTDKE